MTTTTKQAALPVILPEDELYERTAYARTAALDVFYRISPLGYDAKLVRAEAARAAARWVRFDAAHVVAQAAEAQWMRCH